MTPEIENFPTSGWLLFRFRKLCISHTSLRDYLVWELHVGGLAGHFDREKTIEAVESLFH